MRAIISIRRTGRTTASTPRASLEASFMIAITGTPRSRPSASSACGSGSIRSTIATSGASRSRWNLSTAISQEVALQSSMQPVSARASRTSREVRLASTRRARNATAPPATSHVPRTRGTLPTALRMTPVGATSVTRVRDPRAAARSGDPPPAIRDTRLPVADRRAEAPATASRSSRRDRSRGASATISSARHRTTHGAIARTCEGARRDGYAQADGM